jgi:hypothetical protein
MFDSYRARGRARKEGRKFPAQQPPPSTTYRRFLYLDVEKMTDFLSVLRGGEVLERYVLGVSESSRHLGAEIGFAQMGLPASIKAGAQKQKTLEERVQFTTTVHSGFAEIIRALETEGERRVINDQDELDGLTHNQLIELPYRRVRQLDPEENPEGKRDERSRLAKLFGDQPDPPVEFSAILDTEVGPAAIVGDGGFLLVGGQQLCELRYATVVGQVEIPAQGLESVCSCLGRPALRDDTECTVAKDPYGDAKLLLSPVCIYK